MFLLRLLARGCAFFTQFREVFISGSNPVRVARIYAASRAIRVISRQIGSHMARHRSPRKGAPLIVKVGSAEVIIYRDKNRGHPRYTVACFNPTGGRRREFYTDLETAKTAARLAATKLQNGEVNVLELTNQDCSNYLHAVGLLKPLNTRTDLAISEYAEARKALGASGSVLEAARFYAKHHPTSLPCKTMREVLDELLESKGNDHKSARYVSDLNSRLGKFAEAFDCPISEITDNDMQNWLVDLKLAPRGRNNFRNIIITLFNYARKRGYLPKNQPTEAGELTKAKAEEADIEIFTPDQLRRCSLRRTKSSFSTSPSVLSPACAPPNFSGLNGPR
jgi:hypothetical protein